MLKCFGKLRDAIITTLALVNSAMSTLTYEEWETMEEACEVLQPFEEVSVEIRGERYEIYIYIYKIQFNSFGNYK